jgi:hypothetical protein
MLSKEYAVWAGMYALMLCSIGLSMILFALLLLQVGTTVSLLSIQILLPAFLLFAFVSFTSARWFIVFDE